MRKILFVITVLMITARCSNHNPKFDYDLNLLIGTWKVTDVYFDRSNGYVSMQQPTYMVFNSNGAYRWNGSWGNNSGSYIADGNKITTSTNGQIYTKFEVLSLLDRSCELTMYLTDGSLGTAKIKCEKEL